MEKKNQRTNSTVFSEKKKKNFCLHYIISIIFNMNIWREAMQWKDRIWMQFQSYQGEKWSIFRSRWSPAKRRRCVVGGQAGPGAPRCLKVLFSDVFFPPPPPPPLPTIKSVSAWNTPKCSIFPQIVEMSCQKRHFQISEQMPSVHWTQKLLCNLLSVCDPGPLFTLFKPRCSRVFGDRIISHVRRRGLSDKPHESTWRIETMWRRCWNDAFRFPLTWSPLG